VGGKPCKKAKIDVTCQQEKKRRVRQWEIVQTTFTVSGGPSKERGERMLEHGID